MSWKTVQNKLDPYLFWVCIVCIRTHSFHGKWKELWADGLDEDRHCVSWQRRSCANMEVGTRHITCCLPVGSYHTLLMVLLFLYLAYYSHKVGYPSQAANSTDSCLGQTALGAEGYPEASSTGHA